MSIATPMPDLQERTVVIPRAGVGAMLALSAGVMAVLGFWIWLFPYTVDGDSVLHYHNARDAAVHFAASLSAWSRPGYTIPLSFFAPHGEVVARLFNACIALACVWQTVRLAEDLRLRAPIAAGIMVLLQPPAFALAADTMTEIPMALGVVIAVRLWLSGRLVRSSVVVGFLPWLRPEGFFLGTLWGVMALFVRVSWKKRAAMLAALSLGVLAWATLCKIYVGSWLAFEPQLSWPAHAEPTVRGPLWYYAARWPEYCGLPLFILWAAGAWGIVRRGTAPWRLVGGILLLVFSIHSILYWRGLFASWGLIRILASVSPMTAVICLRGWHAMADTLRRRQWPAWSWRTPGLAAFLVLAAIWAGLYYCAIDEHFDCFPMMRCAAFIQRNKLLENGDKLVTGNQVVLAALGIQPAEVMASDLPVDREQCWHTLHELPLGSYVVWDNKQSRGWFRLTTQQLEQWGFTEIDAETIKSPAAIFLGYDASRFVVLRKDRQLPEKAPQ